VLSHSPTTSGAKLGLELAESAPSVVRDQLQWTIYMSRVNLPAVLNDPTLARRETDFFKKTWGEDFEKSEVPPSSHLPHITLDSFRKYLAKNSAVSICIIIIASFSTLAHAHTQSFYGSLDFVQGYPSELVPER